jgi:phosphonatase-like hydrolase
MIKMVVFDMAGTTVDEDNVVYKTLQKAINEAGFDFSLDQVLQEGAGKEKLQAIKSVLAVFGNNYDGQLAESIYQKFIVYLKTAYDELDIKPQPNTKEVFVALKEKGVKVVLNTGYNAATANSLIEKLGWKKGEDFDGLVTASDVEKNRPDPAMIFFAMKAFGITDGKQVVKVGDSSIDIEEGQNAGCGLNIGITTGAHTKQQLLEVKPNYVIDNLMELIPLIA